MTAEHKHTPGPWFLEQTDSALWIGVEKAAGGKVGDVITSLEYGSDYNPWHNEVALANARLIAAAPDLLDALTVLRNTIGDLRNGFAKSVDTARWVEQFQATADRAIAKAEG